MENKNNAVAIRENAEMDLMTMGDVFFKSGFFKDLKDQSQAVVKILAGKELGFGPFASMRSIHIVQGKPMIGADLIAARIKQAERYDFEIKRLDNTGCVIIFYALSKRTGKWELTGESSFTTEDARKAGLDGRDNYKHYMRNMFFARAISNGCSWYCPDVFEGRVYTPGEIPEEESNSRPKSQKQNTLAQKCEAEAQRVKGIDPEFAQRYLDADKTGWDTEKYVAALQALQSRLIKTPVGQEMPEPNPEEIRKQAEQLKEVVESECIKIRQEIINLWDKYDLHDAHRKNSVNNFFGEDADGILENVSDPSSLQAYLEQKTAQYAKNERKE